MGRVKRGPKLVESAISWGILWVLVVVAWGVYVKQGRYDPATVVFTPENIVPAESVVHVEEKESGGSDLSRFAPENLEPAGGMETFGADNLADKIDGKAELYLSAGFMGLSSQRFQVKGDAASWMEMYLYDMGELRNAFSVYSMQKRSGARALALSPFSYRTENALFFVHGKYYVEMVAAVSSDVMAGAMEAMGKRFVAMTPGAEAVIEEMALFPREGLVGGSIAFLVSDAFGFQGMDHIFAATYEVEGREVTAFLSRRKDVQDARELVAAYKGFLAKFGGKEETGKSNIPGAVTMDMLGDAELFFSSGGFVAGARETDDWALVEVVGKRLYEALQGSGDEETSKRSMKKETIDNPPHNAGVLE